MQSDFDNNLQSYFTDMEYLRGMFKEYVVSPSLLKRIIVIHGVGGAGKSSLLRMFRIHCKSEKIPVALASGDDAKSVFDVITRWMDDLKVDGVKFSSLSKTMETYRAIKAKVGDQAKKTQNAGSRIADIASKAASKTAETAGGALLGAAIGSVIPGVGTAIGGALGGVVSGMGADALTDWLRGFLTPPDIDLLLDPEKRLTTDFLADIAKAAEKKRIVLLLDTYEQMTALEDWVGQVGQKLHPNILLVVAGRKLPDWNRTWQGWMANAQVEEIKPMTEDIMRELIQRYYATMHGGEPDPAQVEGIIRFARGLPMVVTSAVQLWVKYGVEDFQSVKVEIVANLVDRLMEGVPSTLIPALEAAAVVRWFDQPILRAVTSLEDVRDVYNELRRFPFVRTRIEGLALHDSVREMMDENLRVQDSERHSELHERAAIFFEKRLEKGNIENGEKLGFERLYHRIRANEISGTNLFQETAEELTRYRLVNRLRALLGDVNTYSLERENSRLWKEYYNTRVIDLEDKFADAKAGYEKILMSPSTDTKLTAYCMSDLGSILARREYLLNDEKGQLTTYYLETSLKQGVNIDKKLLNSLWTLGDVYRRLDDIEKGMPYYQQAIEIVNNFGDQYTATRLEQNLIVKLLFHGRLFAIFQHGELIKQRSQEYKNFPLLEIEFSEGIALPSLWMGRYASIEISQKELLVKLRELKGFDYWQLDRIALVYRMLCHATGLQDKFEASREYYNELTTMIATGRAERKDIMNSLGFSYFGYALARAGELEKAEELLTSSLNLKIDLHDVTGVPEVLTWLGEVYELQAKKHDGISIESQKLFLDKIKNCYTVSPDYAWTSRPYFMCKAFLGLSRVLFILGSYEEIPPLLVEAEQLAQQYEYNDYLASLRLTQGHLAWKNGNQDETFAFYQKAIIYALRYNRFLLDELLSGRPQGTPLLPIIPYCLERGEEGKNILITLRDWWKTGVNDIGVPRPDTISPIPEGIPLLEAEKIARERELGNGSMQKSMIEQIEAVL